MKCRTNVYTCPSCNEPMYISVKDDLTFTTIHTSVIPRSSDLYIMTCANYSDKRSKPHKGTSLQALRSRPINRTYPSSSA